MLLPRLIAITLLGALATAITRHVPTVNADAYLRFAIVAVYVIVAVIVTGRARHQALALISSPSHPQTGVKNMVAHALVIVAYLIIVIFTAGMLHFSLAGLAFGGAITGVVLGLAAQSTLGNLFAGIVLLVLRPYSPGQWVTMRSWYSSGNEYSGSVRDLNLFYTVLEDAGNVRIIPNTAALVSYVTRTTGGARRSLTATLPRTIRLGELRQRITTLAGSSADIRVISVAAESYTITVVLPSGRADLWEEVLAQYVD